MSDSTKILQTSENCPLQVAAIPCTPEIMVGINGTDCYFACQTIETDFIRKAPLDLIDWYLSHGKIPIPETWVIPPIFA